MRQWLIRILGGYTDAGAELLKIVRTTADKETKYAILTEAVKHLYTTIGPDDILHKEGDTYFFEGKPMLPTDYEELREEARTLLGMKLWRVIKADLRFSLSRKMFEEANVELDLVWGKLLIYLDDIIRKRLQTLK